MNILDKFYKFFNVNWMLFFFQTKINIEAQLYQIVRNHRDLGLNQCFFFIWFEFTFQKLKNISHCVLFDSIGYFNDFANMSSLFHRSKQTKLNKTQNYTNSIQSICIEDAEKGSSNNHYYEDIA